MQHQSGVHRLFEKKRGTYSTFSPLNGALYVVCGTLQKPEKIVENKEIYCILQYT